MGDEGLFHRRRDRLFKGAPTQMACIFIRLQKFQARRTVGEMPLEVLGLIRRQVSFEIIYEEIDDLLTAVAHGSMPRYLRYF
jgi:hypothetical protein